MAAVEYGAMGHSPPRRTPRPAKETAIKPFVQVNGIERYYEETVSGDPLLLVNGIGGTSLDWALVLPALAARFRLMASENRGVGRSAAPSGPYPTRQMADDAAALLAHLDVERAHVVGSSMGGMIAQELALAYLALVGHLVLYGTFARPRRAVMDPWLTFVARWAERLDPAAVALGWLPWLYTPAFLVDPDRVEAALAWQNPYSAPAHGIAGQADAARTHDTLDRLPRIAAPTLVLVGDEDMFTPLYYSQELAKGISGARLHVLERGATPRSRSTQRPAPRRCWRSSPPDVGVRIAPRSRRSGPPPCRSGYAGAPSAGIVPASVFTPVSGSPSGRGCAICAPGVVQEAPEL